MRIKISTLIRPAVFAFGLAFVYSSPAFAASAAPLGFQLMCLQSPEQCRGGGSSTIALTEPLLASIRHINSQVNRSISPRNDVGGDQWTLGTSTGDCEDYVLAKREQLMRAGLPASSLRIAHVKTRQGIDHAILVIKTDRMDLALDNLDAEVRQLEQTPYRIVAMSGADPMVWGR